MAHALLGTPTPGHSSIMLLPIEEEAVMAALDGRIDTLCGIWVPGHGGLLQGLLWPMLLDPDDVEH